MFCDRGHFLRNFQLFDFLKGIQNGGETVKMASPQKLEF
jgi:hypothetical protein